MTTVSTMGSLTPSVSKSLFTAVDRNGDQQLSVGEFTAFLDRLVGDLTGGHSTGGLGSAATAIAAPVGTTPPALPSASSLAQPAAAEDAYANIPGFDYTKLSTGGGSAGKYTPAVRAFSRAVASGNFAPGAEGIAGVVAYLRNHGFENAVAAGDSIDFHDGHGPIDVVTNFRSGNNMGWWFNNQPGTAGASRP